MWFGWVKLSEYYHHAKFDIYLSIRQNRNVKVFATYRHLGCLAAGLPNTYHYIGSRQSVGISQETSSHATHQGTLGCGRLSSLSHCELIVV